MKPNLKSKITFAVAILILASGLLSLVGRGTQAQNADLRVMISDGMKTVVEELTPQIEHSIGRKLAPQFNSSKNLREEILTGEPFDAAILTSDVLGDLIVQEKLAADTRVDISRTGMGMGIRAGAAKPNISTTESLRRALMNAKSISFNPTGASASHTYDMLKGLGIADAIKSKLILDAEAGRPQMNVAGGKAELVISLIPEIKFFPGVDLVGPIPPNFQTYINFAAGIATNPHDADAAKALIQFITGPAVTPVLKAKGMEPHK